LDYAQSVEDCLKRLKDALSRLDLESHNDDPNIIHDELNIAIERYILNTDNPSYETINEWLYMIKELEQQAIKQKKATAELISLRKQGKAGVRKYLLNSK
jgi:hypothetical protein